MVPEFKNDEVQSVSLKSFRKIMGYNTFESILQKERDEKKDPADYYNVTVSMMIKRTPDTPAAAPADVFEGNKTLS